MEDPTEQVAAGTPAAAELIALIAILVGMLLPQARFRRAAMRA